MSERSGKGRFGGVNGYSMEVFADAHREALQEEARTRRLLRAARPATAADTEPVAGPPRRGSIGRGLARLARIARPDRPAAAS